MQSSERLNRQMSRDEHLSNTRYAMQELSITQTFYNISRMRQSNKSTKRITKLLSGEKKKDIQAIVKQIANS